MKKSHYYAAIAPDAGQVAYDGSITVRSLLFVSGKQKPVKGRATEKSPKLLEQYSAASNKWLNSGREIPLFQSPHDLKGAYSNADKIGLVGECTSAVITADDIPSEQFSDLVGKTGIFSPISILDEKAIESYNKGLLKEISVGIAEMEEGNGPQIFEASAVPWGAVRGAQVYGHPVASVRGDDGLEKEIEKPEEEGEIYALTMDGAIAERERRSSGRMEEVDSLTYTLGRVLESIQSTSESELAGRDRSTLLSDALADFSIRAREQLGLTSPPTVPTGDQFMKFNYRQPLADIVTALKTGDAIAQPEIQAFSTELKITPEQFTAALTPTDGATAAHYGQIVTAISEKMSKPAAAETNTLTPEIDARFSAMTTQIETYAQQAATAQAQVTELKEKQAVGDRYMLLKSKATQLNSDKKLSAFQFTKMFPTGEQFSVAVERFSAAPITPAEGQEAPLTLDEIDAQLKFAETLQPFQTGSVVGNDSVYSKAPGALSQEEKDDMERFIMGAGLSDTEQKVQLVKIGSIPA